MWGQISIDEELGLAYLPVEMPTGDYYGGHRPGTGLFGESLVAVDLQTGKRKWHYQLVHHGIWDMDIPCAPILADITINGRTVKAVAQPTKQGVLYVFDRVTGQPIWPIEERPVPQGDVPGEWYSPTQPFPTKPPPYERTGVSTDDLIDFTPELRAEALELVKKYKMGPMFTPPVVSKAGRPACIADQGARRHELEGRLVRSRDARGLRVFNRRDRFDGPRPAAGWIFGHALYLGKRAVGSPPHRRQWFCAGGGRSVAGGAGAAAPAEAAAASAGGGVTVRGLPLGKPPYGRISAIDLDKGEIKWQIAARRNAGQRQESSGAQGTRHSAHRPRRHGGTLVTKTLLISGEPRAWTTSTGRARRDAARVRQSHRQRCRRRLHAGAREWRADDLHVQRQAVHRAGRQRRRVFGRVARVQVARLRAAADGQLSFTSRFRMIVTCVFTLSTSTSGIRSEVFGSFSTDLGSRSRSTRTCNRDERMVAVSPPDGTAVLTLIQPAAGSPSRSSLAAPRRSCSSPKTFRPHTASGASRGVRFRHTPRLRRVVYHPPAHGPQPSRTGRQREPAPVWGGVFTRFDDLDGIPSRS